MTTQEDTPVIAPSAALQSLAELFILSVQPTSFSYHTYPERAPILAVGFANSLDLKAFCELTGFRFNPPELTPNKPDYFWASGHGELFGWTIQCSAQDPRPEHDSNGLNRTDPRSQPTCRCGWQGGWHDSEAYANAEFEAHQAMHDRRDKQEAILAKPDGVAWVKAANDIRPAATR